MSEVTTDNQFQELKGIVKQLSNDLSSLKKKIDAGSSTQDEHQDGREIRSHHLFRQTPSRNIQQLIAGGPIHQHEPQSCRHNFANQRRQASVLHKRGWIRNSDCIMVPIFFHCNQEGNMSRGCPARNSMKHLNY